jgi:type IV secretory pathway VirJ component
MIYLVKWRFLVTSVLFALPASIVAQPDVPSLPLYEVQALHVPKGLIFYVTGDGGWNSFSKDLCSALAGKGFDVVALDAKKYFWNERNPEAFSSDMAAVVTHYQKKWAVNDWILVGYSFGADVAPFALSRLDKKVLRLPKACLLLHPSTSTDFEVKVFDMLSMANTVRKYDVLAEIQKTPCPILCIIPQVEQSSPFTNGSLMKVARLPGNHRFDNDIDTLTKSMLSFIELF